MCSIMLFDTGDSRNEYNEPLGIEVIAAKLAQTFGGEIDMKLLWYSCDGLPALPDEGLDILGISLHIGQLDIFRRLYDDLGRLTHRPRVFVGNVAATYGYEHLLKDYPDVVCMLGEGEESFVQIVESMRAGGLELEKINNLAYWRDGIIHLTERRVANLDEYVNPLRRFNDFLLANRGLARIEGSRGCTWQRCSFCCVNYKYDSAPWRPIGVEKVVEQIEELASASFHSLYFTDEDFIGNDPARLETLIERLEEARSGSDAVRGVDYFISIKTTDLLNDRNFALLRRFARAGLREIFIGLESGCDSQLIRYRKCSSREINMRALARAKELDVDVDVGFILFDPDMTLRELEENLDFIEQTELYQYGANFIKRLRVQSFTDFGRSFRVDGLEFDLDRLEYRYQFRDPAIQRIYDLYAGLETDDLAYRVQNEYRGETPSAEVRREQKRRLVELRKRQFHILKRIVKSVADGDVPESKDLLSALEV